jgi:hypothetical protein
MPPAVISAAPGPSDHLQLRRLEKTGGWTRHERMRIAWYRLRLTMQEMNYSTRRLVELQTPLAVTTTVCPAPGLRPRVTPRPRGTQPSMCRAALGHELTA